jgi:hypothetical protein
MISDYITPQLLIKQTLQTVAGASVERMNALVIGPQYAVADPSTDTIETVSFSDAGGELPLAFEQPDGVAYNVTEQSLIVDEDSIKLYADSVEAHLLDESTWSDAAGEAFDGTRAAPHLLIHPTATVRNLAGSPSLTGLRGRNVQVGDKVVITDGASNVISRTVVGFEPVTTDSDFGTDGANGLFGASSANPAVAGSATVAAVSDPANYTYDSATIDADYADLALVRGDQYTEAGEAHFGEKFTVTVATVDSGSDTGTVTFTSSNGQVTGSGTYAITDSGGGAYIITITLPDVAVLVYDMTNGAVDPTVGEQFVVKVNLVYGAANFSTQITANSGSAYVGEVDNTLYIKVKTGKGTASPAVVTIYDQLGAVPAADHNVASTGVTVIPLGSSGISVRFDSLNTLAASGLRGNDVFYIKVKAAAKSATEFNGLILDGPVKFAVGETDAEFEVQIRRVFTGEYLATNLAYGNPFTFDSETSTLEYAAGLTLYQAARSTGYKYITLLDGIGELKASWRAVVPVSVSDKAVIIDESDFEDKLGRIDIQNDLAYGVYSARKGSQNTRVYALRTNGYSRADYVAALKKIERNDLVYALAILTSDIGAIKAVADHCSVMSDETHKNFRRCYFGTDNPGAYNIIDEDSAGNPYLATVTDYAGSNRLVTFTAAIQNLSTLVANGDSLTIDGGTYKVSSVVSNTEIILTTGPAVAIAEPVAVVITKEDNVDNEIDYIINRSKFVNNRRAVNVWCDNGLGYDVYGEYVTIPNKYLACEVAGLRCAQVPWIGLSKTEITSVVEAPLMYSKYETADLDRAAANGVFIITQELEGGEVFIRHQLTTDVSDGILYYEDSVGTNVDSISFQFKDEIDPVIGRRNVNATTLAWVRNKAFEILKSATMADATSEVGPQLIAFADENSELEAVTVKVHPKFKDRILVKAKLEVPVPNNVTAVELEAVTGLTL